MIPAPNRTLRLTVKWCACAVDRAVPRPRGFVILIYHRVGARSPIEVDLPLALFEEQMEVLAASGQVVSLGAALDLVGREAPPDGDPIVITFDDGTDDFAELALPVLDRLRLQTTIYIATEFIETGRPMLFDGRPMSWAAVRDCVATGVVSIGGHTHSHPRMDQLAEPLIADELDRSIGLIEDRVGVRPDDFAYPYGVLGSAAAQTAIKARFRSAALGGSRPNPYMTADVQRLQRSPIQTTDGMRFFHAKRRGGMGFEDRLRRLAGPRLPR